MDGKRIFKLPPAAWSGNEDGAAAVEFALVLPLLMVLLFGIIEWSLFMYNKAMITNASREGARAGVVFRWDVVNDQYDPLDSNEIRDDIVVPYLASNLITFAAVNPAPAVSVSDDDNSGDGFAGNSGDYRTVVVTYPYTFLVFDALIGAVGGSFGPTLNIQGTTTMRME